MTSQYGVPMQVTAKITIQNSTYETWYDFFLSYAEKRAEFVQNEIVENSVQMSPKYPLKLLIWKG